MAHAEAPLSPKSLSRKRAAVFTTAYAEDALRAFGVQAYDHLVKPFEWTRFQAAVDRVARRLFARQTDGSEVVASRAGSQSLRERVR